MDDPSSAPPAVPVPRHGSVLPADLAGLGWDPPRIAWFAQHAPSGLEPARVIANDRGGCLVALAGNPGPVTVARIVVAGVLLRRGKNPVVGDWVGVRRSAGRPDAARLLVPRFTRFARRRSDTDSEQVVAANLDVLGVVTALTQELNPRRLERYLVMAAEGGVRPVLVLNKADLAADVDAEVARVAAVAQGAPVHPVSALTGSGVEDLRAELEPGRTLALVGSSGVGKSTLVNQLLGRDQQATAVTRDDGRGRHTTTRGQLFTVPGGGLLVDTPGLRTVALWEADGGVDDAFEEVTDLAAGCRFADCTHTTEPGCAVTAAARDGRLDPGRLDAYRKLRAELAAIEAREDPRARAARHRSDREARRTVRAHRPRR